MKIFKIIADKRPSECFLCPTNFGVDKSACGIYAEYDSGDGYTGRMKVPDDRCLIEVKG